MARTLLLDAIPATNANGTVEPVTEFLLFRYGSNDTTQGTILLDEDAAKKVMAAYKKRTQARNGELDIDYFHLSRKKESRLEDRRSAGTCKLELREDGIWVVDIQPTEELSDWLKKRWVRSYSPVVSVNAKGILLEVVQLSVTNIPAMDDAGLLAAEDVLDDGSMTLSVTPFQRYPLYEGDTWDAKAADQRLREFLSSDGTDDLSKVDMTRYRKAFVFYDGEAPEATSRYKGQILDVQDMGNGPELVIAKKAVQTLGAAIQGSRGGINLSDADREKGKSLLSRYYKLFDAVAPWDREEKPKMLENATPRVLLQLEAAKWSSETRKMLGTAVGYRFGEYAYIDDFSSDKVRICVYSEGGMQPSRYYELTYTLTGEKVDLGEPVEVVMSYVPKTQAAEVMAMQDRLNTSHTRLLEVTGKTSTSEALVMLEALVARAAKADVLEARTIALEEERFNVSRANQIADAKRSGKWTLALEQQGDRLADMAKRLNEDRVRALETHWEAAPVVIAPGGERPGNVQSTELLLEASTEAILREQAERLKVPYETVLADYRKHVKN